MATYATAANRDFIFGVIEGNIGPPSVVGSAPSPDFDSETWLTPVHTSMLPVEGTCDFLKNANLRAPARDDGYRHHEDTSVDSDVIGSIPTCSMSMPMDRLTLDVILYGMFQQVDEDDGGSPFEKVYVYPSTAAAWGSGGWPDFSADEGYFVSLVKKGQVASSSEIIMSAIPQTVNSHE